MIYASIKILVLCLFCLRMIYWLISENVTEKKRPRSNYKFSFRNLFKKSIFVAIDIFIVLQYTVLNIAPIDGFNLYMQILGAFICGSGFTICIASRKELGYNWTYATDYQIKPSHELVQTGTYSYIRHPIYFGSFLMLFGAEMVACSYLIFAFIGLFFMFYSRAKREDKLLESYFGEIFLKYKKRTKLIIPYFL